MYISIICHYFNFKIAKEPKLAKKYKWTFILTNTT